MAENERNGSNEAGFTPRMSPRGEQLARETRNKFRVTEQAPTGQKKSTAEIAAAFLDFLTGLEPPPPLMC